MKTAIIYYSRTGNTRTAAKLLEDKLRGKHIDVDVVEIEAVKNPGFFTAGSASMKQKELPIKNTGYNLNPYDTLIVGSPTWAGLPSPFIKTFFNSAKNAKGKKAALFITGSAKPEAHEKTKECMKQNLEHAGVIVSDAFLFLQMVKGNIRDGEQQIDEFLQQAIP